MISGELIAAVVVLSGATFIVSAQVARARAVARRGPTVRVSGGVAQAAPYLFWVPYVVAVLRPGPEVPLPDGARALGLALCVAGVALSLWAIATLGRHYDLVLEIHADHQLVRDGPFAWARHPVYTGLIVHFAGACLATGNLILLAGTLFGTIPAFVVRARAEEALLRERFGAEYDRYAKEVRMLAPFL